MRAKFRLIGAYEQRAIRRAYNDALHSLGVKGIIGYTLYVLIGLTSVYFYRGRASMLDELEIWALSALFPAAFIFLWFLFGASAEIDEEQRAQLQHIGGAKMQPHEYAAWDMLDELELRQAACLWAEVQPGRQVPYGAPQAILHRLKISIVRRQLCKRLAILLEQKLSVRDLMSVELDSIPDSFTVSREDLVEYAKSIGDTPAFLFAEERKSSR